MESNNNDDLFPITVITKSDEFVVVDARTNMKIKFLKWKIHMLKKIEPKHQRLFFEGLELEEPNLELSNYGIEPLIDEDGKRQNMEFTIYLVEFYQGIPQTYFLDEAQYDPKWNCSYEGIITQRRPIRGGKSYIQPIGCVRYGLKVLGKYENDIWLGGKGYRTDNEWPVAYHGTNELNVLEILQKGFLIEKGKRFAYGKGIYCSPDPNVALGYAFHYPFEGKIYKLIIQCRVDPSKLQIHGNYWLVTEEKHIRPYAICVFSEDRVTELQAHLKKIGNDHGFQWGSQGGYSQPPPGTIYANSVPLPPPIKPALIKPNKDNAPKSDKSSKSNSTDSANQ